MRSKKQIIALIALDQKPLNKKGKSVDYIMDCELLYGQQQMAEEAQILAIGKHLLDLNEFSQPILICKRDSNLALQAISADLPVMQLISGNNPLDLLRLWEWQKNIPRLVLVTFGQSALACGILLKIMRKKSSIRLISTFFHLPLVRNKRFFKNLFLADYKIFGSAHIAHTLSKYDDHTLPQNGIICLPGINLDQFHQAKEWNSKKHFIFGMSDCLFPQSGALLTIRAMAALWQKDDLPAWEVRMVGAGSRFREALQEADNLGVASRLCLLWDQPLPEITQACHAWIAPGDNENEVPLTLWAGIAAGLPLICTQTALHKERLAGAENVAALRINSLNPQGLARAMIGIMRDSRLRARSIKAGQIFKEQICLDAMADRFIRLLEQFDVYFTQGNDS